METIYLASSFFRDFKKYPCKYIVRRRKSTVCSVFFGILPASFEATFLYVKISILEQLRSTTHLFFNYENMIICVLYKVTASLLFCRAYYMKWKVHSTECKQNSYTVLHHVYYIHKSYFGKITVFEIWKAFPAQVQT